MVRVSASLTGRLYFQEILLVLIFVRGWVLYCDRKEFMWVKNPLTSTGIEPVTFRFVAEYLNRSATAVTKLYGILENFHSKVIAITVLSPLTKSSVLLLISRISVRWSQFKAVCGFAHAPALLFCCSFLKCGRRQNVILISSCHIITFRKLLCLLTIFYRTSNKC